MKKTKERKEKMLKQKGITLIALVITIIVMLILVAVTVSYTIKSGLLGKAQEAKIRQEEEKEKEILGNAYAEYLVEKETDKLNEKTITDFLPGGWSETEEIYTSPKGNKFTVEANGKITLVTDNDKPSIDGETHDYILLALVWNGDNPEFKYYSDEIKNKAFLENLEANIGLVVPITSYGGKINEKDDSDIIYVYYPINGPYIYSLRGDGEESWEVDCKPNSTVNGEEIKSEILGIDVTRIFINKCNISMMPDIPDSITCFSECFDGCTFDFSEGKTYTLTIPTSVTEFGYLFERSNMDGSKLTINYEGTIGDYQLIHGHDNIGTYGSGVGSLTIHCTDGDYTTQG